MCRKNRISVTDNQMNVALKSSSSKAWFSILFQLIKFRKQSRSLQKPFTEKNFIKFTLLRETWHESLREQQQHSFVLVKFMNGTTVVDVNSHHQESSKHVRNSKTTSGNVFRNSLLCKRKLINKTDAQLYSNLRTSEKTIKWLNIEIENLVQSSEAKG